MGIKFEKWQGLGNDFIILTDTDATPELAVKMCDRKFGIGADGIFSPVKSDKADIGWKFYNSDGTSAQMCGNGIRCFAKFVKKHNLTDKNKFSVETLAGIITPEILDNGNVKVDMGSPVLEPSKIPALVDSSLSTIVQGFEATLVSMGNPHCIIFCDEDAEIMAKSYGSSIETDKIFPEKTNVEFVNIVSENKVRVNVWERGCGITLACGTGACATVVAGVNRKLISENTEVVLPGGSLNIFYNKAGDNHVYMQGPAQFVFSGEFEE